MKLKLKLLLLIVGVSILNSAQSQEVRAELFFGNKNPALEVFFIEPFKKKSAFLFISRNNFSIPDYKTDSNSRTQFMTLNVVSYQFRNTGLSIAVEGRGESENSFEGRVGFQFLKANEKHLIYSLLTTKFGSKADARWLTIGQFTPEIKNSLKFFSRAEWTTAFFYSGDHHYSQGVLKIGLEYKSWQFGPGAEWVWKEKDFINEESNYGVFLTKKF